MTRLSERDSQSFENRHADVGQLLSQLMKILSLNVGLPREVAGQGKLVTTGIFKEPADAPVMLRTLNLDGDQQADLTVHGGVNKAVYVYPSEHYGYWRAELPGADLPWGMFGEISRPRDCLRKPSISGTDFESAKRKSWLRNHGCPATNWA